MTKPNTSCKIEVPASLRSDGVRVHPGMPFGFLSESAFGFTGILTTSVLLGEFGKKHLEAVQKFGLGIDDLVLSTTQITALLAPYSSSPRCRHPNVQLGTLFICTGCLCAALWVCAVMRFGSSYRIIDLAPALVYIALTCAGLSLMWRRSPLVRTQSERIAK